MQRIVLWVHGALFKNISWQRLADLSSILESTLLPIRR